MISYNTLYDLQLEVSSLCNARCIMCSRREQGGEKNPTFVETYLTLQNIKDWFPIDLLKQVKIIGMCGNFGDAMTNPELIDIVKYIISVNPDIKFTMNTNGSGRDDNFWRELGELFKGRGQVTFSVDGLEDTNWIYRRGTHWDKIISSMKAYVSTGADSSWDFLVFKHNQHQIEEARELSKKIGITSFYQKKAFGFYDGDDNAMNVYRSDGKFEYTIMAPDEDLQGTNRDPKRDTQNLGKNWLSGKKKTSTGFVEDIKKQLENVESTTKTLHWSFKNYTKPNELSLTDRKLSDLKINCQASESNSVFVDHNGIVVPCCWIGAFYPGDGGDISQPIKEFLEKDGIDKISLKHNSLENIINGEMFSTSWIESFNDYDIRNKRLKACSIFCGVNE